MITIDSDPVINPVNIGGHILYLLSQSNKAQRPIDELYKALFAKFEISYNVYVHSLDWLFVIGAIDITQDGVEIYVLK
ncbi:ABC-three component system middle component 6 [Cobetia amphilecti]|uniref:ABC-three component system middle component 6 n=1 Tax=Cobetia amphilecti TaxID=1055104 RepID=UPI003D7F1A1D